MDRDLYKAAMREEMTHTPDLRIACGSVEDVRVDALGAGVPDGMMCGTGVPYGGVPDGMMCGTGVPYGGVRAEWCTVLAARIDGVRGGG
eukprot:2119437-Rhodomonas_salina.2